LSQKIYEQTAAQHPDFNIEAQLAANDAAGTSGSTTLSKRNKVSLSGLIENWIKLISYSRLLYLSATNTSDRHGVMLLLTLSNTKLLE
jgi:hypothetical protein